MGRERKYIVFFLGVFMCLQSGFGGGQGCRPLSGRDCPQGSRPLSGRDCPSVSRAALRPFAQPPFWPPRHSVEEACALSERSIAVADGAVAHRLRLRTALLLPLRGGEDDINEDEGVEVFRTVDGYDLEPLPTYSLRTPDQDDGVDYGAHGFMFNIENTAKRTVIITGLQICAGDGTPHNYVLYTSAKPWQEAQHDPSAWRECGGSRRVYIPDHEHGVYGKLPMMPVQIPAAHIQAFYIHGDDDSAAVGYRLLNHYADGEAPDQFTDADSTIRISIGRRSTNAYAFPAEGLEELDEMTRAFLGIVEYEVSPHL